MNDRADSAASLTAAQKRASEALDPIFRPRSVAVAGVTQSPGTVPYDIFYNILASGYRGVLYPVAPGKKSISSVRAYRYVEDIDDDVDLGVIVFPSSVVDKALEMCGKKGIRGVIVISAGFREVGPAGLKREQRLKDICREYDIRLIGPNCLGVINTEPEVMLNASFARKMPAEGRIGFLSQSGALCTAVLDYARGKNIGFSKFVSFGNKAGVTEIDLLHYLHADEQTDVILMYLEELRDGRGLLEAARQVTHGPAAKPVLAIKSGRTPQGADAASSHTGALAGEDAVCDAVFQQAGIVRVGSIEELFNAAVLLANQPMPAGDRLAIVTNAGGPGVMATDAAAAAGLEIARFAPATTARLDEALPAAANKKNPVDVIGDARSDRYESAVAAVLEDPNVDEVLVILTPQSMTDIDAIARGVVEVEADATKPIACSFMGATDVQSGIDLLQDRHIPHYILPEWACRAMASVQQVRRWRQTPLGDYEPLPVDREAAGGVLDPAPEGYLDEAGALKVLTAYGLPVPPWQMCTSADEAGDFAERLGKPVVLRVVSPDIVHKSDVGGVVLDVCGREAVAEAYEQMARACGAHGEVRGAIVREMIPEGTEVICGAEHDPAFGAVVMFGLGGVFVEIFRDVTFALAPLDERTAEAMVRRIRGYDLLAGARGRAPADVPSALDCLRRVSQLAADFPRIAEMDLNPLIVAPAGEGCAVADVRIRLSAAN